jgi:hypothetical protein
LLEADYILDAAEARSAEIDLRLPDDYVVTTRDVMETVTVEDTLQKGRTGDLRSLTIDQDSRVEELMGLLGRGRRTAKRAFSGQTVKLRNEFQVGASTPKSLATVLQRARIIVAATGTCFRELHGHGLGEFQPRIPTARMPTTRIPIASRARPRFNARMTRLLRTQFDTRAGTSAGSCH